MPSRPTLSSRCALAAALALGASLPLIQPASAAARPFAVRAWVTPRTMPYDAYPTLFARIITGARCAAEVVYTTGRTPRSFDGSEQAGGKGGVVRWDWHEETKGSGGTATVTCVYHAVTRTAQAVFSVS